MRLKAASPPTPDGFEYGSAAAGVIGIPRSCCPAFHQHRFPLPGNAILRGRDKGAETAPEIPSTHCRDKMRARIPTDSGLFVRVSAITVWLEVRVLPAPPRSLVQTEISRLVANSPELAGIRARILSLQAIGRTSGVVSAHLSLPRKIAFPDSRDGS